MIMDTREKRERLLRNMVDTTRDMITSAEITESYQAMLNRQVEKMCKRMVVDQTLRNYLVNEPSCGKPCTDEQYKQCPCHRCSIFTREFWLRHVQNFTADDIAFIISQWDYDKGFLDLQGGCKLPRKLRPLFCIRGLCQYITGSSLERYDPDNLP